MKKQQLLNNSRPYKENIANLFKSRVDLSGNIGKNSVLISKTRNLFDNRKLAKKEVSSFLLIMLIRLLYVQMQNIELDPQDIRELVEENLYISYLKFKALLNKVSFLAKRREFINENSFISASLTYTSIKLRRPFQKNAETGEIIYNQFFKLRLKGYPHLKLKYRARLRKRLLISRLRNKYKFIIMDKNVALHSFKDVSYSYLVKTNKVKLLSTLYQYRVRRKKKEKISNKDKIFLKRPFQSEKTNRPRFHIIDHSSFNNFFKKMEEQIASAFL